MFLLDKNKVVFFYSFVQESVDKLTTDVYFRGNAGRIEGKYYAGKNRKNPAVLILPPDPAYGGNLENSIVKIIEGCFSRCGFITLRINYRGIGKSDGVFKDQEDAIYDTATALDWLQEQNPEASHFWIAGYSFGAWVAANIMMRRPEIENFILVSPIIKKYDFNFMLPCLCSGAVVTGENDEFSNCEDVFKMVEEMNETGLTHTTFLNIDKAGHLYKGRTDILSDELERYINITLATRVAKPVKKKRRRRKKKDSIF